MIYRRQNFENMMNTNDNNKNSLNDINRLEISFDDIYNKSESEKMKDLLTCPICLNILISPVQCNKCNKCFCKMCIDNYANSKSVCPFRCENPLYNPNKFVENILAILKFKCNNGCDKIINYEDLQKHYEEDCDKIDYKAKYKELIKKYKELQKLFNDNFQSLNKVVPNNNKFPPMSQNNQNFSNDAANNPNRPFFNRAKNNHNLNNPNHYQNNRIMGKVLGRLNKFKNNNTLPKRKRNLS